MKAKLFNFDLQLIDNLAKQTNDIKLDWADRRIAVMDDLTMRKHWWIGAITMQKAFCLPIEPIKALASTTLPLHLDIGKYRTRVKYTESIKGCFFINKSQMDHFKTCDYGILVVKAKDQDKDGLIVDIKGFISRERFFKENIYRPLKEGGNKVHLVYASQLDPIQELIDKHNEIFNKQPDLLDQMWDSGKKITEYKGD
jgi:hypothetical protein